VDTPALSPLRLISSMATRHLLAALAEQGAMAGLPLVTVESVGGVEAARRVAAGERLDLVLLAQDAVQRLAQAGHVWPQTLVPVLRSPMAVAVPAGAPRPDVRTEASLRAAVAALHPAGAGAASAPAIGWSTGPSGAHLQALLHRWGLAPRLVQAPPGVPVAALLARGDVALGFQQLSELTGVPGVDVLGTLPPGAAQDTVFAGAVARTATCPEAAARWLAWAASPEHAALRHAFGMADV
jgi:molybdate transport system substrate-binding protein